MAAIVPCPTGEGRTYPSNKCGRISRSWNKKCGPVPASGKIEKLPGSSRNGKDSVSVMDEVAGMQGGKSEVRDLEGLMHYK